jgi:hypothetical protein
MFESSREGNSMGGTPAAQNADSMGGTPAAQNADSMGGTPAPRNDNGLSGVYSAGGAFMRWSQLARRRSSNPGKRARRTLACAIDALEKRRLFTGETVSTISPILAHTSSPATDAVTLNTYFTDTNLPGTVVTF